MFRSSALALNQIGNLEIPFNSLKLIFLDVNARYWLRIFVNSTVVTCSCKLSSISLQVTLSVNTINTRQNRIKVGNPRHFTAGTSYIAGHQGKLGQIEDIWRRNCYLRKTPNKSIYLTSTNLIQRCVLTSVAEMEGTFDWLTTLIPQSVMEMFQRKSPRLTEYQERLESSVVEWRISMASCENDTSD